LKDWNTMPTSARNRASACPSSASGTPSMVMVPELTVSSRLMHRHSVDLPEPDAPMTTTTSPAATSRLTLSSAWSSPNCLRTFSIRSSGREAVPAGEDMALKVLVRAATFQ